MSTSTTPGTEPATDTAGAVDPTTGRAERLPAKVLRVLLTQRIALLVLLLATVLVTMTQLSANNYLSAPYSTSYLAATLINAVPLVMLGLAELLVITSGRGGIDLSVGAIVSLTGMVFGFAYGEWGWSLPAALVLAVVFGGLCGAVNGALIAYLGFPALITTLATY